MDPEEGGQLRRPWVEPPKVGRVCGTCRSSHGWSDGRPEGQLRQMGVMEASPCILYNKTDVLACWEWYRPHLRVF